MSNAENTPIELIDVDPELHFAPSASSDAAEAAEIEDIFNEIFKDAKFSELRRKFEVLNAYVTAHPASNVTLAQNSISEGESSLPPAIYRILANLKKPSAAEYLQVLQDWQQFLMDDIIVQVDTQKRLKVAKRVIAILKLFSNEPCYRDWEEIINSRSI
uniref:Importin N-terminal domain-containing protein n=1 Tax=Panagrellus redivivus TaxID=6233 RepID=A0A7E4W103_PANRE